MADLATDTVFQPGTAAGVSYLRRAGRGPVLVCLHGIGSRGDSFAPMLPYLPGDWDVIAWNAPGYGASAPLDADWPVEGDYAASLLGMLEALSLGRVTLLGHSLGTLMAARFAADHPGRVDAMVLGACACGHGGAVGQLSDAAADRLSALESEGAAAFAAKRAPRLLADPVGHAEALARVERAMAAVTMPGYGQAVRMLASGRLEASLAEVRVPTGLIWGAGDVVTPRAQTDRAATALQGRAPLRVIETAGHALHAEAPEAFAGALKEILSELDQPDTRTT
ncbi:alpha/beta hydrolase [Pseudooceanicola sediminis]|uniref:Alpha/beta hydrolase n=1 Tax=Pseudooceanicola sediminis TaxID=2211117 RepID=A0A399J5I6_9RHOB|nr:alpha/beta hydrolase [Pseudooceanicola sediminis]KAA2314297.1 alpha/beta hydrolase [Puniceibacterium sp. HSS470]RII39847.1 alpha/beta hydrolase [Pseudooceanicola sediminis]|tara:strand:+ start:30030 stop:30872 length:843 start_codon:yes stop_codon:yes gene_type:complete